MENGTARDPSGATVPAVSDPASTTPAPPRRRAALPTVLAALLLVGCLVVCAAGIPDVMFGRLQAAFPCGDADLDPAHPACRLADPDRAGLALALVLPVPLVLTIAALTASIVLVVRRRPAIAPVLAAAAFVLSLAALLHGHAVLGAELHRIVRL